jgi:hypothetical protein
VVLLLVAGRLAAPPLIAAKVRSSVESMEGGYHGDIDGVELSILSAEVTILGLHIEKSNGKVPVPFMQVKRFILGVARDGYKLRQTVRLVSPNVSFVDAESKAAQQWGPKFELIELREQLPLELEAVYMEDGQVHLRNFEARPAVDVYAHDLEIAWEQLSGCLPPGWPSCKSSLRGEGRVMGSGALALNGGFDRNRNSRFNVAAELTNLKVTQLNPTLLKYVEIDAQGGTIELETIYRMLGDAKRLVVVPRLHDVEIVGGNRERTSLFREIVGGVAAGYFERHSGSKAIGYKSEGAGKGEWSIIDWRSQRDRDAPGEKPVARSRN